MPRVRIPRTVPASNRGPDPRRSRGHLDFIRGLPCCVCGKAPRSEAAHVRSGTDGGMGLKPSDKFTVPLCSRHHREQHQVGEVSFWASRNVDPTGLAEHLWSKSGDQAAGERATLRTLQDVTMKRTA